MNDGGYVHGWDRAMLAMPHTNREVLMFVIYDSPVIIRHMHIAHSDKGGG